MAQSIELLTAFVNIAPSTKGLGKSLLAELGPETDGALDKSGKKMGARMGAALKTAAVAGAASAAAAIGAAAVKGIAEFSALEKGMNEVFTLLPGSSKEAMDSMTTDVRTFAKEMGVVHSEAVPALYSALSAGVPKDTVFDFLETANKAAIGGVSDLDTAVSAIVGPVNAYGEETLNANQASDAMFTAIKNGVTTFPELASTMANVTPVAASLGVDFGNVTAAIATMTAQGTPTASAVTGIRGALLELSKDGTKTADTFKEISGKSFKDFIAGGGNMQEALAMLATHAEKSGLGVNDLFGSVEAGTAALQLTGKNTDAFAEQITAATEAMASGGAVTTAAFDTMDKGLARSWQRIKVGVNDAAIGFGQRLAPAVALGADFILNRLLPGISAAGDYLMTGLIPALGKFAGIIGDAVAPLLREVTGSVRAFIAAWTYNDGDITSDGLAGAMEVFGYWARQTYDWLSSKLPPVLSVFRTLWASSAAVLTGAVIPAIAKVVDWVSRNHRWLVPLVVTIGSGVAAYLAFVKATALVVVGIAKAKMAFAAVKLAILGARVAMIGLNTALLANPVGLVIAALVALGVGLYMAWKHSETFRRIVTGAWEGIKAAAAAVAGWWTGTLVPNFRKTIDQLGNFFSGLYNNVIRPIWTGIRTYIAVTAGILLTIFQGIAWVLDKTLGAAFRWLYNGVVKPVFGWVADRVEWARGVVVAKFALVQAALGILGQRFRDLYEKHVKPVFGWVSDRVEAARVFIDGKFRAVRQYTHDLGKAFLRLYQENIRPAWDNVRDKVTAVWDTLKRVAFDPMVKFVQDTIPGAFDKAQQGVGTQWAKLRGIVRGPVDFFVNTVYNDGLRPNINKVLTLVGLGEDSDNDKRLPRMEMPAGFARGGVIPGYQPRKKDDRLIPMRSGEGVLVPEAVRAMGPDTIHELNGAANAGGVSAAERLWDAMHQDPQPALGSPVYGGISSFVGPFREAVHKFGQMTVWNGNVPPAWQLSNAAAMWDGVAGVGVRMAKNPQDHPYVNVRESNTVPFPSVPNWVGYSTGPNNWLKTDFRLKGTPTSTLRAVAAHELGHSLGLPHTEAHHSIMRPNITDAAKAPTSADIAALQAIYPGGAGKPNTVGDGDTATAGLLSVIVKPLRDFIGGIVGKITDKFQGNLVGEMVGGLGSKLGNAGLDWVVDQATRFGDVVDDLVEGAKRVFKGVANKAQVTAWMTEALTKKGLFSPANLASGIRRAMQESGGDPNAVNNWDINARNGDPSKGLMQTIGATFKQYMEPGHTNIWDPVDNILASINYTIARYGTLRGGWDQPGGYARGGIIPTVFDGGGLLEEGMVGIHQKATPDKVLTDRQWAALYSTARSVRDGVPTSRDGITVQLTMQTPDGADVERAARRASETIVHELTKADL